MADAMPSALEELVEQSREGAKTVEEGSFRLDWSRALDKIKRFQLVDPHRYVLELVQAAVAAQCEQIKVETDADDMIMTFGGTPFDVSELRRIFDYLFSSDLKLVRCRQLAIGVNAALALNPKFIVVESGDGQQGARLEVVSHTEMSLSELQGKNGAPVVNGTRIHVRERKSWKVLVDAVRRETAERQLLKENCCFCPVPLVLDGQDVRRPLDVDALVRQPIDRPGLRGEIIVPSKPQSKSTLVFCKGGVTVVENDLDDWNWLGEVGVVGYVDNPNFGLNASHTELQKDDELNRTRRQVQIAVRKAMKQLSAQVLCDEKAGEPRSVTDEVFPDLRTHLQRAAQVLLRSTRKGELPPELSALLDVPNLVDLPFTDRPFGPLRPFWDAFRSDALIRIVTRRYAVMVEELEGQDVVALGAQPMLRAIFGRKVKCVDERFCTVEEAAATRRQREADRRDPVLRAMQLVKVRIDATEPFEVRGEFGLNHSPAKPPGKQSKGSDKAGVLVTFLRDGVLLGDMMIPDRWLRGRAVLDSPEFAPNDSWTGVKRNAAYKSIGKLLGGAVGKLLAALCEAFPKPPLPEALLALKRWAESDVEIPNDYFDPTTRTARVHIEALLVKAPKLEREDAPWLYSWPLFCTLDGQPRCLDDLVAQEQASGEKIHYVIEQPWGPGLESGLNLSKRQRGILRQYVAGCINANKVLGRRRKELLAEQKRIAERERNLKVAERRRQEPTLDAWRYEAVVALPEELGRGEVGIPRHANAKSWVRVLIDSLPLCDLELVAPVPIQAVVDGSKVEPDEVFASVKKGRAVTNLKNAVIGQATELVEDLVRSGRASSSYGQHLLWRYLEWRCEPKKGKRKRKAKKGEKSKEQAGNPVLLPDAVMDFPLVRTVVHGALSLRQLSAAAASNKGSLRWISFSASEQRSKAPIVICLDRVDTARPALLRRLLGVKMREFDRHLQNELEVLERMRQPRQQARLAARTAVKVAVVGPEIEGELGIPTETTPRHATILVLLDGVPLQLRTMHLYGMPLLGVVSSPRFGANDAFNAVEDDDAWRDAHRALRMAADRLILQACGASRRALTVPEAKTVRCALQAWAKRRFGGRPTLNLEGAPEIDWALAQAPLWKAPDGSMQSLEQLSTAWQARGRVLVVDDEVRGRVAPGRAMVVLESDVTRLALLGIFGKKRVVDGMEVLDRDSAAWKRHQQAPALDPTLSIHFGSFASARIDGEIDGIQISGEAAVLHGQAAGPGDIVVQVGIGGRLLCERLIEHQLDGRAVVACEGLAINEDWTDLADPEQIAQLEAIIDEAIWRSVAKVARRGHTLERHREFDQQQRALLLDALSTLIDRTEPVEGLLGQIGGAPLFETVNHQAMTARDVLELHREKKTVFAVSDALPYGNPPGGRVILHASRLAVQALSAMLGDALVRYDEAWRQELEGQKRRQQRRAEPALESDVVVRTTFQEEGTRGIAGLIRPHALQRPDETGDIASLVRLHVGQRLVVEKAMPWHPAIEVYINDDRLQPNRAFDDVADDDVYKAAMALAQSQIPELVARAIEERQDDWSVSPDDVVRHRLCAHVLSEREALGREASEDPHGPHARIVGGSLWVGIGRMIPSDELLDAAEHNRLATLNPDLEADAAGADTGGKLVVVAGSVERDLLGRTFAELPDFARELKQQQGRRSFLARTEVASVGLDSASLGFGVFFRYVPRGDEPHRGEVGLRPGNLGRVEAQLFHENRPVIKLLLNGPAEAMVAWQDDRLSLTEDCMDFVRDKAFDHAMASIDRAVLDAVGQLAASFDSVPGDRQSDALAVLLGTSGRLKKGNAGDISANDGARAGLAQTLDDLPLLSDSRGGRHTIEQLRALVARDGMLGVISPAVAKQAYDPGRIVICLESSLRRLLEPQISVLHYDSEYALLAEAAARRASAPTEVDINWAATLSRKWFEREGLTADLALGIPFGSGDLAFFSEGHLVRRGAPAKALPGLVGRIDGPLRTDRAFTKVHLKGEHWQWIRELYDTLLDEAVARLVALSREGLPRSPAAEQLALCEYAATRIVQKKQTWVVELVQDIDGNWLDYPELVAEAKLDPVVLLCRQPLSKKQRRELEQELEDPEEVLALVTYGSAALRELLEQVFDPKSLVSFERWTKRGGRRKDKRAERDRKLQRRSNRRLIGTLQGTLRRLLPLADKMGALGLDLPMIGRLVMAAAGKRRPLLDGDKINIEHPAWEAANGRRFDRRALICLTAAVLAEWQGPDFDAAGLLICLAEEATEKSESSARDG